MKKTKFILLTIILLIVIISPINTSAKTIREFEQEVEKFTKDLEDKRNNIAKNDAEVAEIKKNITDIQSKISKIEEETKVIQQEIDESNIEIAEKSQQSKELFQYIQVSEGENAYLEYVFGATSITDMIYRMAIVEQLTEYNDQIMDELTALIERNEERKKELETKNAELKKLRSSLESEKERINADTASLKAAMPGIEKQLKEAKANLTYYKNLGCGSTEDIYACQYRIEQAKANSNNGSGSSSVPVPSASGFFRPMVSGYVTQNWSGFGGHLGMDMSNTNKTINIYPIANGVVFKKFYDDYGALVIKIRHNVNGRYIYSTYAHLSSWCVNEGQVVTTNTKIGNMGNTGYSFGAHLHLEITTCDWNRGGGCTWSEYQRSTINPRQYVGFPSTLRSWWYSR